MSNLNQNTNPNPNPNPRRSKGRQKIEMKKMTNESNLQVTFSKRRSGLFKKASELCTLCGADVAIVVFSPGEKVFSFGHPSVDAILDRYLMRAPPPPSTGTNHYIEAHRSANVRELNAQLTQVSGQLDIEKKCNEELNRLRKATQEQYWWATPIDEMNDGQLEQYKLALENLKKNVTNLADRYVIQNVAANPPNQFFAAGTSSSNNNVPQLPPQFIIPPPQMVPNPLMLQPGHPMLDGNMMMPTGHPGFNNMGGYGPAGFF